MRSASSATNEVVLVGFWTLSSVIGLLTLLSFGSPSTGAGRACHPPPPLMTMSVEVRAVRISDPLKRSRPAWWTGPAPSRRQIHEARLLCFGLALRLVVPVVGDCRSRQ